MRKKDEYTYLRNWQNRREGVKGKDAILKIIYIMPGSFAFNSREKEFSSP